jgi:hypothetical protein
MADPTAVDAMFWCDDTPPSAHAAPGTGTADTTRAGRPNASARPPTTELPLPPILKIARDLLRRR